MPDVHKLWDEEEFFTEQPQEEVAQHIFFRLDQEWYSVDITSVKEIVKVPDIVFLPGAASFIKGIMNLRGTILAVTDLKKIFGLPHADISNSARIIVIRDQEKNTGLLVDEVGGSLEIPVAKIEPPITTLERKASAYIMGETQISEKLIGILNIKSLFKEGSK